MASQQALALNAINELTIVGNGKPLQLSRQTLAVVEPTRIWRGQVLANGPPSRKPSQLPEPASNVLTLRLGDVLGSGQCAQVLAAEALRLTGPHLRLLYPQSPHLPELVVKFAHPDRADALAHEAAMYEEMEILQGVSIPRCYGLFTDSTVSVLLLERMGGLLPLGDTLPEEGDLWDVFRDLARLGIEQTDSIRYANILQAPTGFPSAVCPFHKTTHSYRIIDFDNARKTDHTLQRHYFNTASVLQPILDGIKSKVVLDPWKQSDRPSAL
ncbi:hypothetical protein FA15DRAFT_752583 [Coprinopsis marcescibilis]|uniref:Protein kinase domain-containing protein n=1 Tax=Coprinopsis marcescibilis TaxID=230819 RepID=A0A5C3LLB5_COPMA|nr:hypothetical protein FA15DRAFT_752583 [Coprinopsis marcescibilis]